MPKNLSTIIFALYEYIQNLEKRIEKIEKNEKNSEKKFVAKPPNYYSKK